MGRLGPVLVLVSAVALLGFGSHAALDWHRHGSAGAGFFHLHVHVGQHHHDHHHGHTHDHHHVAHHDGRVQDHDHDGGEPLQPHRSDPDAPTERQDETFSVAFGIGQALPPTVVAGADRSQDQALKPWFVADADLRADDEPWIPRGPPT